MAYNPEIEAEKYFKDLAPIEKQHEEDTRFYFIPTGVGVGKYLPSVTTILDMVNRPYLKQWYRKVGMDEADRVTDIARAIGSEVHHWVEQILHGDQIDAETWQPMAEETKNGIRAFVRFQQEYHFEPLVSQTIEQTVYHLEHGHAGTLDIIGWVTHHTINQGKRTLVLGDWKTSKSHDELNTMQLAAYFASASVLMPGVKPAMGMICRLDKKTGVPDPLFYELPRLRREYTVFRKLVTVWYHIHKKLVYKVNTEGVSQNG